MLERADAIVHAGDFTALSVVEYLSALAPLHAVHGNVDEHAVRAELPAVTRVVSERLRIGVVHDAGPRDGRLARLVREFPGCDAVVYGHSHLPEVTLHEGVWILNPGSPTDRRRAPSQTMIAVHDGTPELVIL